MRKSWWCPWHTRYKLYLIDGSHLAREIGTTHGVKRNNYCQTSFAGDLAVGMPEEQRLEDRARKSFCVFHLTMDYRRIKSICTNIRDNWTLLTYWLNFRGGRPRWTKSGFLELFFLFVGMWVFDSKWKNVVEFQGECATGTFMGGNCCWVNVRSFF